MAVAENIFLWVLVVIQGRIRLTQLIDIGGGGGGGALVKGVMALMM